MKHSLDFFDKIFEIVAGVFALALTRSSIGKKIIIFILDRTAKKVYDWVIRKGYIKKKEIQAEKASEEIKEAKTNEEIKRSFDNLP